MNSCLLQLWILLGCPDEEPNRAALVALGTALRVRCELSPSLTAGAALAARSLPLLEQILE